MASSGVRPARPDDAPALGALQQRAWRAAYAGVLPAGALEVIAAEDTAAAMAQRWREATAAPPSPRHRVLVAVDAGVPVGLAATAPATDRDSEPMLDGELVALVVDPDRLGAGHGSRLLAAAVDSMRGDGFRRAQTWLLAADDALRRFLVSAGWAPDGATRELDMGEPVRQVRLHTGIGEAGGEA